MGDLPPYEAFPIGGTNSVRGYSEGGVGTGRNYAVGTLEMRAPLPIKPVEVRRATALRLAHCSLAATLQSMQSGSLQEAAVHAWLIIVIKRSS